MRRTLLYLCFLLNLSACARFNGALTTRSSIQVATSIPVYYAATVTPFPTATAAPVQVAATQPAAAPPVPIRFEPGQSYVDILDSMEAGTTQTYQLAAQQGQILSVSVRQASEGDSVNPAIQIAGADGTVLQPLGPNDWRGVLPSTQTYLISLSPVADLRDFTLRVVLNPPGVDAQLFHYQSLDGHATLTYTDKFAPARLPPGLLPDRVAPELALQFIDRQPYRDTNLGLAYLLFEASASPERVADCLQPRPGTNETGQLQIAGREVAASEASGALADGLYDASYFQTSFAGTCYALTAFHHYQSIALYPAGFKYFDKAALQAEFQAVLTTLTIK